MHRFCRTSKLLETRIYNYRLPFSALRVIMKADFQTDHQRKESAMESIPSYTQEQIEALSNAYRTLFSTVRLITPEELSVLSDETCPPRRTPAFSAGTAAAVIAAFPSRRIALGVFRPNWNFRTASSGRSWHIPSA